MASNSSSSAARRAVGLTAAIAGALALSGCSQETLEQWGRWGLPEAASDRAPFIGNLWNGAWIASMVIGVIVWGLIFWTLIRYRRRHDGHVPRQTKYNLPMEIMYTLVPFLIIGVLFFFTVQAQNGVLAKEEQQPVHKIDVIGQKWSWSFSYLEADNPAIGADAHTIGTMENLPTLYLPLNKPVRFKLDSADVIHSFWVPDFYFKLDVIPGRTNSFDVTPTKPGRFLGKCAELCGTYHAAMVFNVEVLPEAEYNKKVKEIAALGGAKPKMPAFPATGPKQEG
ncbi:MAG: cytochrome c oxidase subunit II [Propioniciclava sp.]|uniref:aa3-type cytochrome oxidase subunit II n=1 Tax=Propioniciclava sp. TaxID=2038686 RepID=UPI0039E49511